MDFLIGFISGMMIGGWIGLAIASLIAISKDDDSCDKVIDEAIKTLKRQDKPTCLTDDERREELEERYKR